MDLYATGQMRDNNLDKVLEEQGIKIPSIRGVRIMADEDYVSDKDIEKSCRYVYCKTKKLFTPDRYWHPATDKRQARALARRSSRIAYRQLTAYNKHVKEKGVWMVHARVSDNSWIANGGRDIEKQPWFIERVKDGMDATYCDIYVRVN